MNQHSITSQSATPLPPDDTGRRFKVARPDTDQSLPHIGLVGDTYTVLLSGDGGFVLNLGELWTVVQEQPNLLMIVMNDRGYAVIKHMQDAQFNGNRQYGDLLGPDFGGLARLAGLPFQKVSRTADFRVAVARALEINGPAMVEVDMNLIGAHPPYFPYSTLPKAPPPKA